MDRIADDARGAVFRIANDCQVFLRLASTIVLTVSEKECFAGRGGGGAWRGTINALQTTDSRTFLTFRQPYAPFETCHRFTKHIAAVVGESGQAAFAPTIAIADFQTGFVCLERKSNYGPIAASF